MKTVPLVCRLGSLSTAKGSRVYSSAYLLTGQYWIYGRSIRSILVRALQVSEEALVAEGYLGPLRTRRIPLSRSSTLD